MIYGVFSKGDTVKAVKTIGGIIAGSTYTVEGHIIAGRYENCVTIEGLPDDYYEKELFILEKSALEYQEYDIDGDGD